MRFYQYGVLGLCVLALSLDAVARVKLVTLPVRDRVVLQLDQDGVTLVEEEREVPLLEGRNQVDFSWANTAIDPDSILFQVRDADFAVQVLAVNYPPDEAALVWDLSAGAAGTAKVRISYLVKNLQREIRYMAEASEDESRLLLKQYLRLGNYANEGFEAAMLSVDGRQLESRGIRAGHTHELLLRKYQSVPVEKVYRVGLSQSGYLDAARKKLNVAMYYRIRNRAEDGLGQTDLLAGKVRIFQRDGSGGRAFLGEDMGRHTPVGEDLLLGLGMARDIEVRRVIEKSEREKVSGNLYHQDVVLRYEMKNFKNTPVHIDVLESLDALRAELGLSSRQQVEWEIGGQTSFTEDPDPRHSDAEHIQLGARLTAAAARVDDSSPAAQVYHLHIRFKNQW